MTAPSCFGTWEAANPSCMGGFDPGYSGGTTIRPPCLFRETCSLHSTKTTNNVVPLSRLTSGTFSAAANQVRTSTQAYTPKPVQQSGMQVQQHYQPPGQFHVPAQNQQHLSHHQAQMNPMQMMMGRMMEQMMAQVMVPGPTGGTHVDGAAKAATPFSMTDMMRMMMMMRMMGDMMESMNPVQKYPVVEPPPGTFPGQYQAPVNLSPVQMAATNFGVPSYLSSREPRAGRGFWRPLGNEVLRGVMKAVGQVLAHGADHYTLFTEDDR